MYALRNYMEEVVRASLVDVLKANGYCTCERCKSDTSAIVLNNLKPRYIVTEQGAVFTKIDIASNKQFQIDMTASIVKAASQVSQFPRH